MERKFIFVECSGGVVQDVTPRDAPVAILDYDDAEDNLADCERLLEDMEEKNAPPHIIDALREIRQTHIDGKE